VRLDRKAVVSLASPPALSPDGRRIVFSVTDNGGREQLATRLLDQGTATLLPGTAGASAPFFSPDSEWVGFFADGKLKKISVRGGTPVTLCEVLTPRGASWGDDGTIVAGLRNTSGLFRIPDAGGTATPFTQLAPGESTHRWPQVLPGVGAVLFTASPSIVASEDASIRVVSRDAGTAKTVVQNGYFGRYLPVDARHGYLLYIRDGTLFGAAFDPVRLEVRGNAVPVLDDVATSTGIGIGTFDVSNTGTFVYVPGTGADRSWPVVWLTSDGRTMTLIANEAAYDSPRIAPDGKRLALQVSTGRARDLYVFDIERDTLSRLTFAGGGSPVWTRDGRHIAYSGNGRDSGAILWVRSDGSSSEPVKLLQSTRVTLNPYSFSPDGRYLTYFETSAETRFDIAVASLDLSDPDHPKVLQTESFLKTTFSELEPNFSPDGRWILYRSNETGVMEAYVRPFRGSGKWQISSGGAMHPRWSPAGRQLFYETLDGHVMVADYSVQGDSFVATKPRQWTATAIRAPSSGFNMDIAPTGDRLVVFPGPADAEKEPGDGHATLLLNFVDELRRRIPIE
jgi:serine/threonine-protein kinase